MKQKDKHSGNNTALLVRFFVPYALILLGSLFVGWFAYDKTSELVESETLNSSNAALGQIREALDRRLAEIETIARQMSNEPKLQSFQFVKQPYGGTHPYSMMDLEKSLFNYRLFNHFIVDYYVAFKNSEMAISPGKVYTMKQFYNLQLQHEEWSFDQWRSRLFDTYHYKTYMSGTPITYEGKPYSAVSFMHSFGTKDGGGVITVLINNGQIREMLRNSFTEKGGFAYIADADGNLISYVGTDESSLDLKALTINRDVSQITWNGEEMLMTQTTSAFNGWTYVSAQPKSVVLEKANYIKELTMNIFLIALLLGLAVAAYFAYRSSRPFLKLIQMLPGPGQEGNRGAFANAVEYIRNSVSELIERHDALQERLEEQLPLMRSVFYDRLLKGGYTSHRDIEAAMEHARVSLKAPHYMAVILRLRGYHAPYNEEMLTELDIVKLKLRDRIRELSAAPVILHDLGENLMALILQGDERDTEAFLQRVRKQLQDMYGMLIGETGAGLYMAAGGSRTRLAELYRSFGEARFVLLHARWDDKCCIQFHEDLEIAVPSYDYPSDTEVRLIQVVKSGNISETERLLDDVRMKNGGERHLPVVVERLFAQELCGTLLKCCEQSAPSEITEEAETVLRASDPSLAPALAVEMLCAALMNLCRKNAARRKSRNDDLTARLISYIEQHYADPDLSLTILAREARTSEAYVSYFFKEQTGMNFSDYLEDIRMKEARRLLESSTKAVNEIAAAVGYLSLNTFSRAFKRAHGISATEYRRLNRAG